MTSVSMEEDTVSQEQQQQHHYQQDHHEGPSVSNTDPPVSEVETAEGSQESLQEQPLQEQPLLEQALQEQTLLEQTLLEQTLQEQPVQEQPLEEQPSQYSESSETPSKRTFPDNEESTQTSMEPFSQLSPRQENEAGLESPSSLSKRRRISIPGKSILKTASQGEDGDMTGNQEIPDEPTFESVAASDITDNFSSTTEFLKRNRKSISRRVSFAATARIRMFERDEKEDELPKTMSFLEGLSPKVVLNTPFTFDNGPGSQENTNDTMESATSPDAEESSQDHGEHTEGSDSEKERSFEVNIYSGHSDSTGSSSAGAALFLPSTDSNDFKTPFDDGDLDTGSSSEEESSHFFPDPKLMKRSSGVGIFHDDRDSILGPQFDLNQTMRSEVMDDDAQDYGMEYRFQKHRSSIPERLQAPLLQPSLFQQASDETGERSGGDEDVDMDMDITAPIGGIHEIAHDLAEELPPTAFHNIGDNTATFSDLESMDMTQPLGGILSGLIAESAVNENESDRRDTEAANIPFTPVKSSGSLPIFDDNNNDIFDNGASDEHKANDEDFAAGPSTPPPRGSSLRVNDGSPIAFPRRSLGTPGRFTPTVKARLNMFPEVLEKQLQTLETSTPAEPVFRASYVSPETSNLAKRIYRYSMGSYSRASGDFHSRLSGNGDELQDRQYEDREGTMDMADELMLASVQDSSNDIFNESPVMVDEYLVESQVVGSRQVDTIQNRSEDVPSEAEDGAHDEGGDEDSFVELPPITLSKFLSLVGVSFLDHLNASTRRRTIPHRAGDGDSSTATYRSADLVKAMAVSVPELHSYREACRLLKQSIDASRAFADEQEKKVSKKNPEYFREFRESNADTKEFMKERFKMIKVHSKLETNVAFSIWKTDVLKAQQETLEQHLVELGKDISNLATLRSSLETEKTKILPRQGELKLQVAEATDRQRSYELCDKEQLVSLAEAAEEQGAQIEHYESVKAKKGKELAELRARVEKLRVTEQSEKSRIAVAEKTIRDNQYVRMEDLGWAKDMLSIIEATHRWEPLRPNSSTFSPMAAAAILQPVPGQPLEFVYDKTLKVSIDFEKIGKDPNAVQVAEFGSEEMDFDLSLVDRQRIKAITALAPKRWKDIKEYAGLLRDYTTMIASKYKAGTTISKILSDVSQFWNKICLIRRDVELVRAHHIVDLVAGSAENLKELENNNSNSNGAAPQRQVAGTTPTVVLDIRVRFTGPLKGTRRSTQDRGDRDGGADTDMDGVGNGHHRSNTKHGDVPSTEPVKFYLWFTFSLTDLLSFPGPNSFTWRLEVVYGNISNEHVSQAVGPVAKKGGYEVLREICIAVNQLLKI